MPQTYDALFAQEAARGKFLTTDQAKDLLSRLSPGQSLARFTIQSKLISLESAQKIIETINGRGGEQHPPIAVPKRDTSVRPTSAAAVAVPRPKSAAAPAVPRPKSVAAPAIPRPKTAAAPAVPRPPSAAAPAVPPRRATSPGAPAVARPKSGAAPAVAAEPPRRVSRYAAAVPAAKKSRAPLLIGGVVVALLAVGGGIFVLTRPKTKPEPPVAQKPKEERKEEKREKKEESTPKKEEVVPKKAPTEHDLFLERLAEKRKKGEETLAECRTKLKSQREAEHKRAEEFRKRMEKQRVTVKLTSGTTYRDAVLRDFDFEELQIQTDAALSVPWILVSPESIHDLARLLFPGDLYERARFLTARKLWKEARDAYLESAKKDENRAEKVKEIVEILDKLIKGEGTFHGSARRIGLSGLQLTYDFQDPEQAGDFPGPRLKIEGGSLEIPEGRWRVSDLKFTDELDVEMKVKTSAKVILALSSGRLEIDKDTKLFKEGDSAEIAKGAGIKGDAEAALRLSIRGTKLEFYIGKDKILEGDLPAKDSKDIGPFSFGAAGGTARIAAPLVVRGNVDANELNKRFAEVEVLVRRATSGEMDNLQSEMEAEREARVLGTREKYQVEDISANDLFFIRMKDLSAYDDLKSRMIQYLSVGYAEDLLEKLDAMIKEFPQTPSLHYYRALYFRRRGDMDEARKSYSESLKLFPEFHEAMIGLAEAHLWEREFDEGLAFVDKALALRPDDASAYALRAMLRYGKTLSFDREFKLDGQTGDDLDIAITLDPNDESATEHRRSIRAEAKGPGHLGCVYRKESEHYVVVTDISQQAAEEYSNRLETAFVYYREYAGDIYKGQFRRKPRVAVFNTNEAYYTYNELISMGRSENTLGLFRPWFDELALFEEANVDRSRVTLYHEAFHHFMSLITNRRMPYWFNEGMADYIGGLSIEGGKHQKKARVLKDETNRIQSDLARGYSTPFEKIMTESPGEFYSGDVGHKYSQSWSMLHFFHHGKGGKYRPLVDKYFRTLLAGKSRKEAFDEVFKEKASDLEKEWKEYVPTLKPD